MKKLILLISLIVEFTSLAVLHSSTDSIPYYLANAASAHNLDVTLLYAICDVESRCKTDAVNRDDAQKAKKRLGIKEHSLGMFQIKLATARALGFKGKRKDLMKPEINSWWAAELLQNLYKRYGHSTSKVISAYNAGKYVITNKRYVNKVLSKYAHYKLDKRL